MKARNAHGTPLGADENEFQDVKRGAKDMNKKLRQKEATKEMTKEAEARRTKEKIREEAKRKAEENKRREQANAIAAAREEVNEPVEVASLRLFEATGAIEPPPRCLIEVAFRTHVPHVRVGVPRTTPFVLPDALELL